MCNAFNGIAIVLCFRGISSVTGFSEAIWQVIITLAIIISTWYSANYFAALEARRDKRRYLLLAWVVMTILLNFIHLGGGERHLLKDHTMTLAMLLVLISHHKGLTLLLIVIIALLFIALTPLVKKLLSHLHDRS